MSGCSIDAGPANLSYNTSSASSSTSAAAVWVIGMWQSLTPLSSVYSSGYPVASFSVSPVLPSGLSLDSSSGVIAGITKQVASATSYVVNASNSIGSVAVVLLISAQGVCMHCFVSLGGFF